MAARRAPAAVMRPETVVVDYVIHQQNQLEVARYYLMRENLRQLGWTEEQIEIIANELVVAPAPPAHPMGPQGAQMLPDDVLNDMRQEQQYVDLVVDLERAEIRRANARRMITLVDLPLDTTYGNITAIIRGGPLLDMCFISRRAYGKCADVAFVYEDDATAFMEHLITHALYIKGKRVVARWAREQPNPNEALLSAISLGATRTVIISGCDHHHTQQRIRQCLFSLGTGSVIKLDMIGTKCYIELSCVTNAVYARLHLTQHALFQGTRLSWGIDECAQPLRAETYREMACRLGTAVMTLLFRL